MVVVIKRQLSRYLLPGAVALLFSFNSFSQEIHFTAGSVVVDKLNAEVLYTFVRYHGKQEVWADVFPVKVKGASRNILGNYIVSDSAVSFVPQFPFARGVNYEATFFTAQLANNPNEVYLPKMNDATLNLEFRLAPANTEVPVVVSVFPTADEIPENLLRFHIEFSSPMSRGELYDRVHIYDEQQKVVEKALLVVDEELWDDDMRSVTVMLDPGRIKRGLKANLDMSAPLIAGKSYTLVIDPGWKNSDGQQIEKKVEKKFRCYAADRSTPSPSKWQFISPSHADEPLVVKTNESFDIVLLRRAILVTDALGTRVEGRLTISGHETTIAFVPDKPWGHDKYSVMINPALEDLAGNKMNRLFDVDVTEKGNDEKGLPKPVTFVVKNTSY